MQIDLLVQGAELCHRSGSKQFGVGGGGMGMLKGKERSSTPLLDSPQGVVRLTSQG